VRLAVTMLGLDLLTVEITTDAESDEPGDCITTPVGFTVSAGDQRWQAAPGGGEL
jgi:hypothetical protein